MQMPHKFCGRFEYQRLHFHDDSNEIIEIEPPLTAMSFNIDRISR